MPGCDASSLWCIIFIMHQCCDACSALCLWFVGCNALMVYVEMQCYEWVMYGMMHCDGVMNGWCMGDELQMWCVILMHGWMNEWVNEWTMNVGNVEWLCAFCCIQSVFVICLCIFSGLFNWRINPIYTSGQEFVILHTNPTCNITFTVIYGI